MMRQSICALAVAAACVMGVDAQAAVKLEGATATAFQVSESGAGHFLVVPYFSTQSGNALLLSLINMDEVNGKAVKLRFRSAGNADALFDFQVFLAPGDMWTANVSQNAEGLSFLTTEDASCTKPAKSVINATPFQTARLNPQATAAARAGETREGYIEIVTMADIPPSSQGVYPVIDLNNGFARCANTSSNTAWSSLDTNWSTQSEYAALGLQPPSTGLTANWTIINVPNALTWSGLALALEARKDGKAALGNVAYFPQTLTKAAAPSAYSADPLFAGITPFVDVRLNDLPDISTPYLAGLSRANTQAAQLADLLAVKAVANEFWTEPSIDAATDWVFSMPTRRFAVGRQYGSAQVQPKWVVNKQMDRHFAAENAPDVWSGSTTFDDNSVPTGYCQLEPDRSVNDRETRYASDSSWSELAIVRADFLCHAVNVQDIDSPFGLSKGVLQTGQPASGRAVGVANGWMRLSVPGAQGNGVPLMGQAYVRARNANVTPGTEGNFSLTWPHRLFKD